MEKLPPVGGTAVHDGHASSHEVVHKVFKCCLERLEIFNQHINSLIPFSSRASKRVVTGVWHVAGEVAVATSLH